MAKPGPTLRSWCALALGIALIWAFMFVLAPALQGVSVIGALSRYVRDTGMDPSALYYTDVPEAAEAELHLRGALSTAADRR